MNSLVESPPLARSEPALKTSAKLGLALLVLGALASLALGLVLGTVPIPLSGVLGVLVGLPAPHWQEVVVWQVRLPRVLVAWWVGAALAVSGAALQALFRNPLADSSTLGVSSAAALGAVLAMYLGLAFVVPWAVPISACLGAALAMLVLWALGGRRARGEITTVLLSGLALGQLAIALSSLVVSFALADYRIARRVLGWLLGELDGRTWLHVAWGALPIGVGSVAILREARNLDALLLDEVVAVASGVDAAGVRKRIVLWTSVLTGIAVAIAGTIGFVGLVVPHLLRTVIGSSHRVLLPAALVSGGTLLVLADALARTVIAPEQLQVGIVTAALGAPLFLYLLVRRRRGGFS
jgi:iron complex transport system permease protein